jgi:hypothetical protein
MRFSKDLLLLSFSIRLCASTPDDMLKTNSVGGVQVSPDGRLVAFTVTRRDLRKSHPISQVWIAHAEGSTPWLNEISESDVYRRFLAISVLASSSALEASIAAAPPPSSTAAARQRAPGIPATPRDAMSALWYARNPHVGSNMYALGPRSTQNGVSIILTNPHFPWFGSDRLYLFDAAVRGNSPCYRRAGRDLKPANILVTKQGVKLLDFGLAKHGGPLQETNAMLTEALTGKGEILGTLQYMSPEQLQGKEGSTRSDLFSFGCVLYEMLSDKRAFEGQCAASVIAAIL